ncbi:two-component response regulator [Fulvivirga imtechensis AK7]|uniref:Two-component response regulator n=2 Tax=Fulvivirga TaxID=396811 RepID=L8JZU3_9BACT|nr:two-component response regulator [Fulvivirga imtechensis AK7]
MLVDDNEIDIFINQKILEFNRFAKKLLTFNSGRTALDYLGSSALEDLPEVIFLDLNMPVIDGFRFLYEFSKFPEKIKKKSSIVILTSSDNLRDKEKVKVNVDVIQFLSKPLNDQKVDKIRMMLQKV